MVDDRTRRNLVNGLRLALWHDPARLAANDDRLGRWGAWFRFRRHADIVLTIALGLGLLALYAT